MIEQFVQETIDYSSQYGHRDARAYNMQNLVGYDSNQHGVYSDSSTAAVFRTYNVYWKKCPSAEPVLNSQLTGGYHSSEDFFIVAVEKPIYLSKISVHENYNPGALVRIFALTDASHKWVRIWQSANGGEPDPHVEPKFRVFEPQLEVIPDEPCREFRFEYCQKYCAYYTELNAIKFVGSTDPPTAQKQQQQQQQLHRTSITSGLQQQQQQPQKQRRRGEAQLDGGGDEQVTELANRISDSSALNISSEASDSPSFYLLAIELKLKILGYLDLASLCRMRRVSKVALDLVDEVLRNVRHLNLRPLWHVADRGLIQAVLGGGKLECITHLDISWLGLHWDWAHHNSYCSGIPEVLLQDCGHNLVSLSVAACRGVAASDLRSLSELCPNLRELNLASCQSLETGWHYLKEFHRLTRLNLYNCKISVETVGELVQSGLCDLEHLNLGAILKASPSDWDSLFEILGSHCFNLVSLDVWRSHVSLTGLERLINGCANLEELDLGWCCNLSFSVEYSSIFKLAPNLKKVYFTAVRSVIDEVLICIAENCDKLEQLDVLGNNGVSATGVDAILNNCANMAMFDMSFCNKISESQVMAWRVAHPNCNFLKSFA